MKIKNILMTLGLGSMLMTSCSLDEEVYTFISGEDLAADGEYELLVNGAYQPLADLFRVVVMTLRLIMIMIIRQVLVGLLRKPELVTFITMVVLITFLNIIRLPFIVLTIITI